MMNALLFICTVCCSEGSNILSRIHPIMSSSSLLGWRVYRKTTLSPRVDTVEPELNHLMQENSPRKAGEVKVQMS